MDIEELKKLVVEAFPSATVEVTGDGYHHEVIVVSEIFENQSLVNRQKSIYKVLSSQIQSGELHALSIKAKTPAEWQA